MDPASARRAFLVGSVNETLHKLAVAIKHEEMDTQAPGEDCMNLHQVGYRCSVTSIVKALCGVGLIFTLGCSTAKPPEQPQTATQTTQSRANTKRLASAPVSQASSLAQLQKGAPVGTPASSPLKDVYFDFDRYDLRPDARATLQANADWLKQNPTATVQIEGHCDDRGTAEYNLALGAKRAQSAKDYLATLGVDAKRLSTISYGQELPVCTEHNEECWQKNRHDRFVAKAAATS
jgi:peptidoglycan-associated lipoprotein